MHRAVVPVATMLAIQAMISLCVLALGVMMPAVAADLAIDPKLVGIFTAIIYAVAAVTGAGRGRADRAAGRGAHLPGALLMAAIGLAFNALAMVAATVIAVMFIGAAQGPINPASAHVLAQRVPREWFGMVFSLKQTGVPIGFALAGLIFPFLLAHLGLARRQPGRRRRWPSWRRSSSSCCAPASMWWSPPASRRSASGAPSASCWAIASCACSAGRRFVYVIAQHTFTFYLVTYLYEHCGLSIARAGFLLSVSQLVGTAVRLVSGAHGRPDAAHAAPGLDRHRHDAGLHRHRPAGGGHAVLADRAWSSWATARSSSAGTARRRPSSPISRRPARRLPWPRCRPPSPSRARCSARRCSP